jgi:trehalose/maltose transport system substrate-binding protein
MIYQPMRAMSAALAAGLAVVCSSGSVLAAQLAISCGAVGQELELCRQGVAAFEKTTGHSVTIVSTPNQTEQRLALYQQLLAARSPDIDVLQIDVVWPGVLGRHFIDLAPHVPEDVIDSHFDAIVANNRVGGRLVALPWFLDVGLRAPFSAPSGRRASTCGATCSRPAPTRGSHATRWNG